MTLKEFNSPIWTGGTQVKYCGKFYDVVSVDFEEFTIKCQKDNNKTFVVSYDLVEIKK